MSYGLQHNRIPEEVVQLADTESLKDIIRGRHGLIQQFSMWQALMGMEHPLPPFYRILPLIHAKWNVKKTASDTATKMIDGSGNRIIPPNANINANTLATAHYSTMHLFHVTSSINFSLLQLTCCMQLYSSFTMMLTTG